MEIDGRVTSRWADEGTDTHIRGLKTDVWPSYCKRQAVVCGLRFYVTRLLIFGT